jgi:hypothetical protein
MHGISRSWIRPVDCSTRWCGRGPSRTSRPAASTTHAVNGCDAEPGGSGARVALSQLRSPLELSAHRARRCEAHRTVGLLSVRALRILQVPIPYAIASPDRSRAEGLTPALKIQHRSRTPGAHLCTTLVRNQLEHRCYYSPPSYARGSRNRRRASDVYEDPD